MWEEYVHPVVDWSTKIGYLQKFLVFYFFLFFIFYNGFY